MAEAFLDELLQTPNSIQSDDRNCVICLQETGRISRETGYIELLVRLPCTHCVGSGCIARWLKENNSCPCCRREFFPAQPRPYLEHGVMEGQEDEDQEDEDQEDEDQENEELPPDRPDLERLCEDYCSQLCLDRRTANVAKVISLNVLPVGILSHMVIESLDNVLAAVSIYITSCISGHPRSPREILRVRDMFGDRIGERYSIDADNIRENYGIFYDRRQHLITVPWFEGHRAVDWASIAHQVSDNQIECYRDLPAMQILCAGKCEQLQVKVPVRELSQHIAANLVQAGFRLLGHTEVSIFVSQSEIAAVSIYIASHLVGQPIDREIIQLLNIDEYEDLRSIYRVVRGKCDQLVSEAFRETLDIQLSWETLEIDIREESDVGEEDEEKGED